MKVEKLDHVHIYTLDLEKARKFWEDLLGSKFDDQVNSIPELGTRFIKHPMGIGLVEATSPDGVVARAIEKRGEGLSGISLKVADIEQAIAEMQAKGLRLTGRATVGAKKEAFFHPKDAFGVAIELTE